MDYDRYGAGEARLGWLDEELEIFSPEGRAVVAATRLVNAIYSGIRRRHYAIGHLKFLLTAADWHRKISFTSVTDPLLRETEGTPRIDRLTVIVNVRVRCSPAELSHVVALARRQAAASEDIHIETLGSEAFTPGYPTPTHRIT